MDDMEEGWIMQGNHYYHKGDYNKALECYQKAVSHENNAHAAWNIHNRLSACYNRLENYEQVEKEAEKMIELDPHAAKGYVRRAGAAFFKGKFKEAQSDYEKAELILHKTSKNEAVKKLEANLVKYQRVNQIKLKESSEILNED